MVEIEQVVQRFEPRARRLRVVHASTKPAHELVERSHRLAFGADLGPRTGRLAQWPAVEHAMDVDPAQTEDASHPGLRAPVRMDSRPPCTNAVSS